eukprot:1300688-Amphidinium_carterae.1
MAIQSDVACLRNAMRLPSVLSLRTINSIAVKSCFKNASFDCKTLWHVFDSDRSCVPAPLRFRLAFARLPRDGNDIISMTFAGSHWQSAGYDSALRA